MHSPLRSFLRVSFAFQCCINQIMLQKALNRLEIFLNVPMLCWCCFLHTYKSYFYMSARGWCRHSTILFSYFTHSHTGEKNFQSICESEKKINQSYTSYKSGWKLRFNHFSVTNGLQKKVSTNWYIYPTKVNRNGWITIHPLIYSKIILANKYSLRWPNDLLKTFLRD